MDIIARLNLKTGNELKVRMIKKLLNTKVKAVKVRGNLYHVKDEHFFMKQPNSSYVVYYNESDLCQDLVDDFFKISENKA